MSIAAATKYAVTELSPTGDRDDVLDLWRRTLPGASEARYAWLYERGPACGLLLRDEAGQCVGTAGAMRRSFFCEGVETSVGQAVDLGVAPEHRTVGPAMKLVRAVAATVAEGRFRFLYAFPNAQSQPVLVRVGYRPLGPFQRWVKLLRSESHLKPYLRRPWLTKAAAGVVDFGLRLAGRELPTATPRGVRFETVDAFDDRFDDLWRRARDGYAYVGRRTADYLNWRFAQAPDCRHRTLTMLDAAGRLVGYVVYCRVADVVYVGDLLTAEPAQLAPLVAALVRQMRRERAESIVFCFLGPPRVADALRRLGFWQRPSSWTVLVYAGTAAKMAASMTPADATGGDVRSPALFDPARWWLTRADVDTDL